MTARVIPITREDVSRLAPEAPPCFATRLSWVEFVHASVIEGSGKRVGPIDRRHGEARFNVRFNFCASCLASHALAKLAEGKCKPDHLLNTENAHAG